MKRRILQVLIALLVLFVIAQIPFIYRRIQIGQIADTIRRTNADRPPPTSTKFREYKGVIHVHTAHSGELSDMYDEMLAASASNVLDFVLLTEHYSSKFDTSAATLTGQYGSTLFVAGNEIDTATGDRFLMLPGGPLADDFRLMQTTQVLERIHADGGIALIAYPEKFKSWDAQFDGIEIFNPNTELKKASIPLALGDVLWSWPAYPDLTLARHLTRPTENIDRFDSSTKQKRNVMVAGLDAHSAIGFHLLGDELGQDFLGLKFDSYEEIFRLARLHVLIENEKPLDQPNLLDAIRRGRFFNGFDTLGDTTGFLFNIADGVMGDEIALAAGMELSATAPVSARFVVIKNGERFLEVNGGLTMRTPIDSPGVYRVEVYRTDLGDSYATIPWILSNPIYVR